LFLPPTLMARKRTTYVFIGLIISLKGETKTPCFHIVFLLGGGGEIRTPAPGLPRLMI
jgi:hypothetical protein